MNIGKTLTVSAIAGMLMGTMVGCGGAPSVPATPDPAAAAGSAAPSSGGKASCSASGGSKSSCSASGGSTAAPSKY